MSDDFYDQASDESTSYRDCRYEQMQPIASEPSVDISTRLMKEKIDKSHCRLLERATHGRLTFRGDQIISTTPHLRERESAVALIRKQIEKLEAKSQVKECPERYSGRPAALPRQVASAKSQCDGDILDCQAVPY